MKLEKEFYISVLSSLLGYIGGIITIKLFFYNPSNAEYFGIIFFSLSPILNYKIKNINPFILFLLNFCATFILGLIFK
ncbi:MAG: hypothetical protein LC122_10900 [Chitinophagales bacterium]|nr:hypothetical protein [Chitinophagales bacterium]